MTYVRIPMSLTILCSIAVAAAGAWAAGPAPPDPAGVQGSAGATVPPPGLPDIESLTAESNFSAFMKEDVPGELRRRALRKLWSLDPQLAAADGLGDYVHDYTNAATRAFAEARRLTVPDDRPTAAGMPILPPPDLPAVGSLTLDSDFALFMTEGVSAELRHRALRTLWSVGPQFRLVDGLGDYNADYAGTRAAHVFGTPAQVTVRLGSDGDEFTITPAQLRFGTDERYELVVTNPSATTHYFSAPGFGANVITQKAVLYDDARHFVRIWLDGERPGADSSFLEQLTRGIEIRPGGEARWIFVPNQAGHFDFGCAIEGHRKEGMVGSITVGI